jgi:hypothetical protein
MPQVGKICRIRRGGRQEMPGKNVLNAGLKSKESEICRTHRESFAAGPSLAGQGAGKMPPADKMSPVYLEEGLERCL